MYEEINAVNIFISDLHLSRSALQRPELLRPELRFLTDRDAYFQAYQRPDHVETDHFVFQPLRRELRRNRFWEHYSKIGFPREAGWGPWHLQLPWIGRPKQTRVSLVDPPFQASVQPVVFLRPSGWSSSLEISLRGSFRPEQVIDLVEGLRFRDSLSLNQVPGRFSRIFQALARALQKDLFVPGSSPWVTPKMFKHFVISVASAKGEALPYRRNKARAGQSRMQDFDRARVHSFLTGRDTAVEDLPDLEGSPSFMLTDLWRNDFAVSRFGWGESGEKYGDSAVLSLTDRLSSKSKTEAGLWCLTANIRSCWLQSLSLLYLLIELQESPDLYPEGVEPLEWAAQHILAVLPKAYNNSFCRDLFLKNSLFSQFKDLGDEPATSEASGESAPAAG